MRIDILRKVFNSNKEIAHLMSGRYLDFKGWLLLTTAVITTTGVRTAMVPSSFSNWYWATEGNLVGSLSHTHTTMCVRKTVLSSIQNALVWEIKVNCRTHHLEHQTQAKCKLDVHVEQLKKDVSKYEKADVPYEKMGFWQGWMKFSLR